MMIMTKKYPNQVCKKIHRNCTVKVYVNPDRIHVMNNKKETILNLTHNPKKKADKS